MKIKMPYSCQQIDQSDINAVMDVMRSDFLTTGPKVDEFEEKVAAYCHAKHGVAVSSGTAGLHAAMYAAGIGPGDEVIIPAITFVATANAVAFCKATPIFCDVNEHDLLASIEDIENKITDKTRAIVIVDYAGQPYSHYLYLPGLANDHNLIIIEDACHALGAYDGMSGEVGSISDLTVFSFHPVKTITTGEGGMVMTNNDEYAEKMKRFRNHGISSDYKTREKNNSWEYSMTELGYNYRITDMQCALGISQMDKVDLFMRQREALANIYDYLTDDIDGVEPIDRPRGSEGAIDAYHLYVVKFDNEQIRNHMFNFLRKKGIGVNVHYMPVHLHPYYQETYGTHEGMCPVAESCYKRILSLPLHPGMSENDVRYVCDLIKKGLKSL
jgi:UDP-4-amino-4,6-dideoxy-N-acetyl-beta-L-altrosamine transaminase